MLVSKEIIDLISSPTMLTCLASATPKDKSVKKILATSSDPTLPLSYNTKKNGQQMWIITGSLSNNSLLLISLQFWGATTLAMPSPEGEKEVAGRPA